MAYRLALTAVGFRDKNNSLCYLVLGKQDPGETVLCCYGSWENRSGVGPVRAL